MLAAALTLATTSPAYAFEFVSGGNGSRQATIAARHHSKDPAGRTVTGTGGFAYAGSGNRYLAFSPSLSRAHRHA
jgi:hypothetical protein